MVQTFIVHWDFAQSAKCLSIKHLGKQRVEAVQIYNALTKSSGGWINHPAVRSWRPYPQALQHYANCMIQEWINRGKNNTIPFFVIKEPIIFPWWSQWDRFHNNHKSLLLRKDPSWYLGIFGFGVPDCYHKYGYIWPHSLSYNERNLPLSIITAPPPKELVDPLYCQSVLKTGTRKGHVCSQIVKDKYKNEYGTPLCGIHRK